MTPNIPFRQTMTTPATSPSSISAPPSPSTAVAEQSPPSPCPTPPSPLPSSPALESPSATPQIPAPPRAGPPALPPLEDAFALVSTPLVIPPELIAGILHRGSKLGVGGASKSKKTWTLMDLAISVGSGTEWLGRQTKQGLVLYVNLEIQNPFFIDRMRKIAAAKGVEISQNQLHVLNLRGNAADYKTVCNWIIYYLLRAEYSLVVIDPMYKILGDADENSARDMGMMMNSLEQLCCDAHKNPALAYAAHFSKGNQSAKNAMDRISGSGVFGRDADTILTFTEHKEPDAFTVEATLRNHPPLPPFVVRWDFPLMHIDEDLNPADLRKAGNRGRNQKYSDDDILDALPLLGATSQQWFEAAEKRIGIKHSTFHERVKGLEGAGKVKQDENGLWSGV